MNRRLSAALVAVALSAAACGGGEGDDTSATTIELESTESDMVAQVASYDLQVDTAQRFLVGLVTSDNELVGGGEVDLAFGYLGTEDEPLDGSTVDFEARGSYLLLPGQDPAAEPAEPTLVDPSEATGLYRATDIEFDRAGFWGVRVTVDVDGEQRTADAAFEVIDDSKVVEVGDPAPKTVNHLPGAAGVPVKAVDSRAEDDGAVPDEILHELTVADALAAGRPTVVVISTPVYCVSRFCGPITEEVAAIAERSNDDVAFVHLEVWRDYEGQAINKAAAEWVYPAGAEEMKEPWVFVVGRDGTVTHRFDNVTAAEELTDAIAAVSA